jgi:hypothetical protein
MGCNRVGAVAKPARLWVTKAQAAEMRRKRADLNEKLRQLMSAERERRH